MAVEQPLLPDLRIRDTQVPIVELDHGGPEGRRVAGDLQGEAIRAGLPTAGPRELGGDEGSGDDPAVQGEEGQRRDVVEGGEAERRPRPRGGAGRDGKHEEGDTRAEDGAP